MRKIRIGNDISVLWSINNNGSPYDLTNKDLSLYLTNQNKTFNIADFDVYDNKVAFNFLGKDQGNFGLGEYLLTLIENEKERGMVTLDRCQAFSLVPSSCMAGGSDSYTNLKTESVSLDSDIYTTVVKPIIPVIGENGNWFVDGKDTGKPSRGVKGDPFVYEDFTEDQLEGLRGPRGYDGSILYPKFEVRDDMHLTVISELATNRIKFDENTGRLYFKLD